jgi:Flp pilus assembly protein TadG
MGHKMNVSFSPGGNVDGLFEASPDIVVLSSRCIAVEGIVEKRMHHSAMHGGKTMMKMKTKFRGPVAASKKSLIRATEPVQPRAEAPPPGHRILNLLSLGERGSALVEMALIMPVLLILTTGIFVFGIAMNNYVTLTNAVSTGARTVALNAQLTTDPCAVASSAVEAAAPGLNPNLMTFSYTFNGVAKSGTSCSSSSVDTGAALDLASGTTVTVTATYPLNLSVFGTQMSGSNAVLQATSTELVQ